MTGKNAKLNPIYVDIGNRLKVIRKELGLTQSHFCQTFNINRSNYSRIERGIVPLNISLLKFINKQLQISANWLVTGEGEENALKQLRKKAAKRLVERSSDAQKLANTLSIDPNLLNFLKEKMAEFHKRNRKILDKETNDSLTRFTGQKQCNHL